MGGISGRSAPRLACSPMKKLIFLLCMLMSGFALSASVAISPAAGIVKGSGGWSTASNFVGTFSSAAFNNNFTTQVAGKAVTMPASMRLAANAGQFAISAIRLNPAALVLGATAAYLLSHGLEYSPGGEWFMNRQGVGIEWSPINVGGWYPSKDAACAVGVNAKCGSGYSWGYDGDNCAPYPSGGGPNFCSSYVGLAKRDSTSSTRVPATEEDWAGIQTQQIPDSVATELAPKIALPLQDPLFNPKYQDLPLSDPYIDPVTGKPYRDSARVTPQTNGETADVQTTKQEVDENGDPKVDPETGEEKPPEEQTEFCKENPDAVMCLDKGETDDEALETNNVGTSITPVSVGGGGSCPADRLVNLHGGGGSLTISYKPICDMASMVNPIVIAMAWLIAGYILIGAMRNE